jgi:hypothetical protein
VMIGRLVSFPPTALSLPTHLCHSYCIEPAITYLCHSHRIELAQADGNPVTISILFTASLLVTKSRGKYLLQYCDYIQWGFIAGTSINKLDYIARCLIINNANTTTIPIAHRIKPIKGIVLDVSVLLLDPTIVKLVCWLSLC